METTFDVDFLNSGNADLECLPNDLANTDEYRTGTAADENDASHPGSTSVQRPVAEDSLNITGDIAQRLEEYCNWMLTQTISDRWRAELEKGTQCALDHFLELNSVMQHPNAAINILVRSGAKPGVALQFVSKANIKKWWDNLKNVATGED
ncbi:hypothetical protein JX266_014179 [Neoarthrinium moseri]|nr:hypothetical protein JX266_014179 [Neoarthrinium moseri]